MAKTNVQRIEALENEMVEVNGKLDAIINLLSNGNTVKSSTKGNSKPTAKSDLALTQAQIAIVKKWKPTHRLGTDKGSINKSVRGCAYEFCGGKENYNEELYKLGKMAWFKTYDKAFRDALPQTK